MQLIDLRTMASFFIVYVTKQIISTMEKKQSKRGRNQDRSKVAAGQGYEVNYEKNKLNVSANEVKDAVKSEGNSRKKVEKKLSK